MHILRARLRALRAWTKLGARPKEGIWSLYFAGKVRGKKLFNTMEEISYANPLSIPAPHAVAARWCL